MNDWAEECAERWRWALGSDGSILETGEAIEGAVREALAKAVEVAADGVCGENCKHLGCMEALTIGAAIRALGAAK